MFMQCKNVKEAQWLAEQLQNEVEIICDEKIDEIESDEELYRGTNDKSKIFR